MALGCLALPVLTLEIPIVLRSHPSADASAEDGSPASGVFSMLDGKPFHAGRSIQTGVLSVRLKNLPLLIVTNIVVPVVTTLALTSGGGMLKPMEVGSGRYTAVYALGYCSIFFLVFAWQWLTGRLLLRSPGVAVAVINQQYHGKLEGPLVAYYFQDSAGHYHGGTSLDLRKHKDDNVVPVLFDHAHPDVSRPFWSFLFHRVQLILVGE